MIVALMLHDSRSSSRVSRHSTFALDAKWLGCLAAELLESGNTDESVSGIDHCPQDVALQLPRQVLLDTRG